MCSSDPEFMSITDLLALEPGSMEGLGGLCMGYIEYPGGPELRRELATLYESIDTDNLIVHTGAQQAILSFVHTPGCQSRYSIAETAGVSVSLWIAREYENWALYPEELEKLVRRQTKALLICALGRGRRTLPDVLKISKNYLRERGTK